MRAHFNRPIADRMGNQIDTASIRLLAPQSTELIAETIYAQTTGGLTRANPWTTVNGEIDFYLDSPSRVQIGITVAGGVEEFWDDVDVLAVAADSTHQGLGADSTQVGTGSSSAGNGATALGTGASAAAPLSIAIGRQAAASADGGISMGAQAAASQVGALAIGGSSVADGAQAIALGDAARSSYDHSTAIGAGAETTRPNQVAVGTEDDLVEVPGTAVLHSPNGTPFIVKVTNDGLLYTQQLADYPTPPG
ncbi:hypothetical protein E6R60_26205 [Streptomyces sp. A0642]|uniref:hypothetical protein n=1 Tax=Streptomyces sp. A0642 TaxID=2563100 RepID=UPI0010A216B8|nr:hypothetical protein [Streptomyces sp. A0642]THA72430.1 hypothetical protein E6R60_26205 [Streptomyces sp. A0642]